MKQWPVLASDSPRLPFPALHLAFSGGGGQSQSSAGSEEAVVSEQEAAVAAAYWKVRWAERPEA